MYCRCTLCRWTPPLYAVVRCFDEGFPILFVVVPSTHCFFFVAIGKFLFLTPHPTPFPFHICPLIRVSCYVNWVKSLRQLHTRSKYMFVRANLLFFISRFSFARLSTCVFSPLRRGACPLLRRPRRLGSGVRLRFVFVQLARQRPTTQFLCVALYYFKTWKVPLHYLRGPPALPPFYRIIVVLGF